MSPSRRSRRRYERQRAKKPVRRRTVNPLTRIALVVAGALFVVGGIALVASGSAGNAARLSRIAGILIIVGLVLAGIGLLGKM